MKYVLLCLVLTFAACGKKDTIVMPATPAEKGEPAKPERPVATKPHKDKFFLDALL